MRQPLAVILLLASGAADSPDLPVPVRVALEGIKGQADTLVDVVRSTLCSQTRQVSVDVCQVVGDVVASQRLTWDGSLSSSHWRGPEASVLGDRVGLRRAVANLVENAARAAGAQGRVRVLVRSETSWVEVSVEDDGPGFGRVAPRTGLGLEVVRAVAARHGGVVLVERSRLGGAKVRMRLATGRQLSEEPAAAP
jgi:signal transduction histidine kinase